MATTSISTSTIADLERQIAKVTAALDKARAQQMLAAEKSASNAEALLIKTKAKLVALTAKGATTPAIKAKIVVAKEVYTLHRAAMDDAKKVLNDLREEKKIAAKFAKTATKTVAQNSKSKDGKVKPLVRVVKKDKPTKKTDSKVQKVDIKVSSVKATKVSSVVQPAAAKPVKVRVNAVKKHTEKSEVGAPIMSSAPMTSPIEEFVEDVGVSQPIKFDTTERSGAIETPATPELSETNSERSETNIEPPRSSAAI